MKWEWYFLGILLTVSNFHCEDVDEDDEEEKEVEKIIHPDEADKSSSDAIINYNSLVLEAEKKIENKEESEFKNLLHGDANTLKSLSEGDMVLDKKDIEMENGSMNPDERRKRGMTAFARKLWFSKIIPYEFDHPGTRKKSASKVRAAVLEGFEAISKVSCLKFRPKRSGDQNWLRIFKGSGCYAGIGRKYWEVKSTQVSLGDYCIIQPIIQHEILHALGFFHEQTRTDRDSFVNVYFKNINPSMVSNFKRHPSYDQDAQNTMYDYNGLMHYGNKAFSINGQDTLSSKFDHNRPLGGPVLTPLDIKELNNMYKCDKSEKDIWSDWGLWTSCYIDWKRGCVKTRQRVCFAHPDKEKCKEGDKFGVQDEFKKCNEDDCKNEKLIPHWGAWAEYSKCSRQCGDGYFIRTRTCNNPPPTSGSDEKCVGLRHQTSLCKLKRCYPEYYPDDVDFENGFKPWRQDEKAVLKWQITDGPTPSEQSGPTKPFLTRHYAYLTTTSNAENNKRGRLISREINHYSSPLCVTFYYQMNGRMIEYLDFYIKTVSGVFKTFWSKKNHRGNYWRKGAFTVPQQLEKYEIVMEGMTGRAPHSDIAVDDIRINKGKCFPGSEGCNDHYKNCPWWMKNGECHKNYKWMLKGCCQSCASMADCEDKFDKTSNEEKCSSWARKGECAKNPIWMWKNCCNSCKACVDYSHGCAYWAKDGWCEKSQWMKDNCKSSCNICKV